MKNDNQVVEALNAAELMQVIREDSLALGKIVAVNEIHAALLSEAGEKFAQGLDDLARTYRTIAHNVHQRCEHYSTAHDKGRESSREALKIYYARMFRLETLVAERDSQLEVK